MDLQTEVNNRLILWHIQRDIFCRVSGKVMDIRTAVGVCDSDGDVVAALSPEGYREKRQDLIALFPDITFINAPEG